MSGYTCVKIANEYTEVAKENVPWIHKVYGMDGVKQFGITRTNKKLTCQGNVKLNTGEQVYVLFSTSIDSAGLRWVGGRVRLFPKTRKALFFRTRYPIFAR